MSFKLLGALEGAGVNTPGAVTANDCCASSPSPRAPSCGLRLIVQVPALRKSTAEGGIWTPPLFKVTDRVDPGTILQTSGVAVENTRGQPKEERAVGL